MNGERTTSHRESLVRGSRREACDLWVAGAAAAPSPEVAPEVVVVATHGSASGGFGVASFKLDEVGSAEIRSGVEPREGRERAK